MGNRKVPHTSCYRGKRVRVILKDGRSFDDRFFERTARHVFLYSGRKLHKSDIRAFMILKS